MHSASESEHLARRPVDRPFGVRTGTRLAAALGTVLASIGVAPRSAYAQCAVTAIGCLSGETVRAARGRRSALHNLNVVRSAPAREPPSAEQTATVTGSLGRSLEQLPGSVTLIRREDLAANAPQHSGDVLRNVPGLHVVGEDGMGLRLNISVRGLDPNRSRKVLVLEDGIPVSLNPYGSPELYYSPPIERMERVEVVRGSAQILYGPQTIGGVINFISLGPPRSTAAQAELRFGSYGYMVAHAGGGVTEGPVGFRLDVLHRRFDGPRHLDLFATDVNARMRVNFGSNSTLNIKFNFYDERSAATYAGPTTPQFAVDPAAQQAPSDRFLLRRYALSVAHDVRLTETLRLRTNVYAYQTDRVWRRQIFDRRDLGAVYEHICDATGRCGLPADPSLMLEPAGSSLYFRRTAALRDRKFTVAGVEPRLTYRWAHSRVLTGELNLVLRMQYELANEAVYLGATPTSESGETQEQEHRNGFAFAAAVQHRFSLWGKLHVTPGVRLETFASDRRILFGPAADAPNSGPMEVNVVGQAFSTAVIPGIGVAVEPSRSTTIYAGFHRGYSPPRVKDAVSNTGLNLQLDAELSWNTELGARLRLGRWLSMDVAAFLIEFDNQIIPPSESNAVISRGQFNTGHSRHAGLESTATFDLASLLRVRGLELPLAINYTYVPVAMIMGGLFGGNRVPYAPPHILSAQLRFKHRSGLFAQVGANYISTQYVDQENTSFASIDGLIGVLPAYLTLDARASYTWASEGITVSLTGRNLTDQTYIASRAPQGIQPAGFRQFFVGVEWRLPERGQR